MTINSDKMKRISFICGLVVGITTVVWGGLAIAQTGQIATPNASYGSGEFFFPPYPSANDRMGFGKASGNDASVLQGGWYVNWGANLNPLNPGGAAYARTIMLHADVPWCQAATEHLQISPSLTGTTLVEAVQRHPGSVWLVGNEPDSLYNGDPIQPELYAELYRYFLTTIKQADPTAKVAVAAIVQPSPLRMEYLDKVLDHYEVTYGEPLHSDLWNIHFYILNEGPCGSWGSAVPPFSSQDTGWQLNFTPQGLLDLEAMEENLRAFRQWMKDRGHQDKPLIITEFGVLPPTTFPGFSNAVAAQFLEDSFDLFLTAADPDIGYPADDDKLVQMWAWFSTYFGPYGGDLFVNESTNTLTIIGEAFVDQTVNNFTPYIDLQPIPAATYPSPAPGTTAVHAFIANRGNITASSVSARIELVDYFNNTVLDQEDFDLGNIGKRYNHTPAYIGKGWTVTPPYAYTASIVANPSQSLADANPANDTLSILVAAFADLAVANIAVTTDTANISGQYDADTSIQAVVTTTISNTGDWTSTQSIPIQIQIQQVNRSGVIQSGPIVSDEQSIPTLAPEENFVITSTWPISPEKSYRIIAIINPEAVPGVEIDNGNSQASTLILNSQAADGLKYYFPLIFVPDLDVDRTSVQPDLPNDIKDRWGTQPWRFIPPVGYVE